MKTVVCLVEGKLCRIDVEESKTVADIIIMLARQTNSPLPSYCMEVYLMKRNGKWLKRASPEAQQLMRLSIPFRVRATIILHGAIRLSSVNDPAFGFLDTEDVGDDDIHVLVRNVTLKVAHRRMHEFGWYGVPYHVTALRWLRKRLLSTNVGP
ncbi:hypothetical protein AaE_013402 [Aphanomyces astaci]|uniref:Uncharacterized protein n=1 Tax=Aphanomyces astaci TaxID=112090 RepID=A0A6A4ZC63_APHAT|nr:hypothetical protein AaE_013402 [Aphanomyces astaci]